MLLIDQSSFLQVRPLPIDLTSSLLGRPLLIDQSSFLLERLLIRLIICFLALLLPTKMSTFSLVKRSIIMPISSLKKPSARLFVLDFDWR